MWQARKNEEEKCRLYFAKVYELKKEEAMKTEYEEVEYEHYSELTELFNDDNLFHAKCGMFLKVDEFDVLVELVEDGDEVYKRNKNSGDEMKTEIKYEKLEYNFWNLSELEEYFQKGELYHKAGGQFYQFKNLSELSTSVVVKSGIYKRVETPMTIEDDLLEIGKVFPKHELGFILADDNETLKIYYREFYQLDFEAKLIHALSEALKRHGK